MKSRPRRTDDSSSMFWFVRLFVMLALAAVVIIGLGFLLPEERTAVNTTLIDAPLDRVFQIVTDVEKQIAWRSDVKSVHVERRGDLWAWTEDQKTGTTFTVEETAKRPQERYEFKYTTSNGMRGRWLGEFEALNEDRTKLTLTQTVVIENPLRRVAAYILLNLDALMDVYLGDLNRYASAPESAIDPLLRSGTPFPSPTPSPTAEAPLVDEPVVPPTPSPTVPSPTVIRPSLTPPTVIPPPTVEPTTSPTTEPLQPVITATSVTLPSPTSLPPNTPSLLTPNATPSPTAAPSASPSPSVTPPAPFPAATPVSAPSATPTAASTASPSGTKP